jgi:hypothetical protein
VVVFFTIGPFSDKIPGLHLRYQGCIFYGRALTHTAATVHYASVAPMAFFP